MISLYNALQTDLTIVQITGVSLKEAVRKVYLDDAFKYRLLLNSELIDVKKRFRVFNYNGDIYIAKQSSLLDAKHEIEAATVAHKRLHGICINDIELKILVPEIIEINREVFIVSKYQGQTIQEHIYSGGERAFSIEDLFSILRLLIEKGVLYRGYLPRNMIQINENTIVFIDWEDAIFTEDNSMKRVNSLWRTNFMLNWGYFFEVDKLSKRMKIFESNQLNNFEPELSKYEREFKRLISWSDSDIKLRELIENVVFEAECPLNERVVNFCIHPHDMAHLVADFFIVQIDVLYDIATYDFRKRNRKIFSAYLFIMTNLILDGYKNEVELQPYILLLILMLMDEKLPQNTFVTMLNCNTIIKFVEFLSEFENTPKWIQKYFTGSLEGLRQDVSEVILSLLKRSGLRCSREFLDLEVICDYVILQSHKLSEACYE